MTTQPLDPKLVDQFADVIVEADDDTHDYPAQARAALAWLDQTGRLACDPVVPEWGSWTAAERVCLRPAGHTYPSGQPSRHRGLCGSWSA